MDNIAEGFGRGSKLEFINSLTIAKGEYEELKSQLYRGLDIDYFTVQDFNEFYSDVKSPYEENWCIRFLSEQINN